MEPTLGNSSCTSRQMLISRAQLLATLAIFCVYIYILFDVPHSYFYLFSPADRFNDFINTVRSAGLSKPYDTNIQQTAIPCYGALTYLLLKPIAILSHEKEASFLIKIWAIIAGLSLAVSSYCLARSHSMIQSLQFNGSSCNKFQSVLAVGLAIISSYQFLFTFDRGNIELITFAIISVYIFLVVKTTQVSSKYLSLLSLFILVIAVSIKPYLCIFGFVFFHASNRKAPSMAFKRGLIRSCQALLYSFILNGFCLATFYRSNIFEGYKQYSTQQKLYYSHYIVGPDGSLFTVSPFELIKEIITKLSPNHTEYFIKLYPLMAFLVCALAVFGCFLFKNFFFKFSMICLVIPITILCFPYIANEYKAIYLIIPFLLSFSGENIHFNSHTKKTLISEYSNLFLNNFTWIIVTPVLFNRYAVISSTYRASAVASILVLVIPFLIIILAYFKTAAKSYRKIVN